MNRIYISSSYKVSITARFILLGVVVFGLVLPVGAQAFQLPDFTATPTATVTIPPSPTPTATDPQRSSTSETTYTSLSVPSNAAQLASDRSLALLAGKFIFRGLVDASACDADGGLLKSRAASPCGEAAAHKAVILWQNQFDAEIYTAARKNGVPPFVLKNVFIKESQFWPATYQNPKYGGEYGLGHMTMMGADTLLSWNRSFYKKLCNEHYSGEACKKEYVFQNPGIKSGLKGIILKSINADCSTCVGGVDLEKARNSVSITAAMLAANENYVEWLVNGFSSTSQLTPKNRWRFTLASYNAGMGCFTQGFYSARKNGNPLSWKDVAEGFDKTCKKTIDYVDYVMDNVDTADPGSLILASTDQSLAARMVLGMAPNSVITAFTPSTATAVISGTPPTGSETPTPTITGTPFTETPTPETIVSGTSFTDTPTPTSGSETPTPEVSVTETPVPGSETPTPVIPSTGTLLADTPTATETPVPTNTLVVTPSSTDEIVVKFNGMVPDFLAASTIGSAGGEIQTQVDALGLTIVSAPADQSQQVLAYLQGSMLVEYAEPNYAVQAFYTPNDPDYTNQTYLADMQIPEAWDITRGEGIIVAVIDTGVDVQHPDLESNIWVNPGEDGLDANGNDKRSNNIDDDGDGYVDNWMGWNFVDNNNDARDGNGHGTHTAGIIAAQMDNTLGISGIAPRARIMPIKALDNTGFGTYSQVAQAIIYAVDHGAKVINLGFGGTADSEILLAATNYAYDHNVVVIAAGGNTGSKTIFYPAANPNVIGVSALDQNLKVTNFSSSSDAIRISAPGVGIFSTAPNGNYATMSGTSMAAAQVSGVAALLATQPQFDTTDKIRDVLFATAFDLGDPGLDASYGYGLVRAFEALKYVPGSFITATPSLTPVATVTRVFVTPVIIGTGGVHVLASMSISSPADSSTFAKGAGIAFSGSATDSGGGDLSASLQWSSNIDGPIGSGASFSYANLTPGTHTITAQAKDSNGTTGSASINVTITPLSGPHGDFNGTTDECAVCHRAHSAAGPNEQLNFSLSSTASNDFCLSCHNGTTARAVSTHSNIDAKMKIESQFEVLCVQCHDPHGTSNLFAVRSNVFATINPDTTTGPVKFTALTGDNSFDDGGSSGSTSSNRICVTCHTSAMTNGHAGGANHKGGSGNDYTGLSCISCHPHDADGMPSTKDGFAPVRGACDSCHDAPPATGAHLAHSNSTVKPTAYGETGVNSSTTEYGFACGECHPTDVSKHMDGTVEVDLNPSSAPAASLKAKNDPAAAYAGNTCSNTYCHSGETVSSGAVGNSLVDGAGNPILDAYNNFTYAPYTVTTTRDYKTTPNWVSGTISGLCTDCHSFPLKTSYPTVQAGVGDSHQWVDNYGYGNLHAWNMGYTPITCSTCHYGEITAPGTSSRNGMDVTTYSPVPIDNHTTHVNGLSNITFTTTPIIYSTSGGPVTVNLGSALYDSNKQACGNVGCHLDQTYVKWGTPYRWWTNECGLCHRDVSGLPKLGTVISMNVNTDSSSLPPLLTAPQAVHPAIPVGSTCKTCHINPHGN